MIYARCETCGELVYRYTPDRPLAGEMGNATQDCWHQHQSSDGHIPTWKEDTDR